MCLSLSLCLSFSVFVFTVIKQNQIRFHEEYSGSAGRLGVGGFGCVHLVHDRFSFKKNYFTIDD